MNCPNCNYEEYKKQRAQLFEEWCEENSDWLPEYY